jgi:hypothetical protein
MYCDLVYLLLEEFYLEVLYLITVSFVQGFWNDLSGTDGHNSSDKPIGVVQNRFGCQQEWLSLPVLLAYRFEL